MSDSEKLGRAFKRWREDKGLSLRQAESLTGISWRSLWRLERGKQDLSYSKGKTIERLIGMGVP